ncbi:MAG: hypothetical protein AAF597_02555, partial [Bacteroidota bacterium]
MHKLSLRFFYLFLVLGLFITGCGPEEPLLPAGPEDEVSEMAPDLLVEWTDVLLGAERFAGGMRPNGSARALAHIYLAAYETAQPSMADKYISNFYDPEGRLYLPDEPQPNVEVDVELALHACLNTVVNHFLINLPDSCRQEIANFAAGKRAQLSAELSDREIIQADNYGRYIALRVIAYSQTDTEAETQIQDPQPLSYVPPVAPGYWTFSAEPERGLFPFWERTNTFVLAADEATTVPPIPYSTEPGSPYRLEMEEVYQANNDALAEDGEQLWIAEFWSDDVTGLMMSPPARQIAIANQL